MSFVSAAVLLFLVMDPLGNIPLFLSALKQVPPERQRKVILREMLIALAVLLEDVDGTHGCAKNVEAGLELPHDSCHTDARRYADAHV